MGGGYLKKIMGGKNMSQKVIFWLIVISLAMTATPIVILANKIQPFVLGMPFFAFWNIFWPTVIFILSVVYSNIADKNNN